MNGDDGGDGRMKENSRWDAFYANTQTTPPWESDLPFSHLPALPYITENTGMAVIELGCGASASAVFLAEKGHSVVGVDVSPNALERARMLYPDSSVRWEEGDILDDGWRACHAGKYEFVLDIQVFHVLRLSAEAEITSLISDLLVPGGMAMVVAGADTSDIPEVEDEPVLDPGPPMMTKSALIQSFATHAPGLSVVSITLSRFNQTPDYAARASRPPRCWVVLFQRDLPSLSE